MNTDKAVEIFASVARPLATHLSAVGLFVGSFTPAVTVDKMWVLAAVVGSLGAARSFDKKTAANADPQTPAKE